MIGERQRRGKDWPCVAPGGRVWGEEKESATRRKQAEEGRQGERTLGPGEGKAVGRRRLRTRCSKKYDEGRNATELAGDIAGDHGVSRKQRTRSMKEREEKWELHVYKPFVDLYRGQTQGKEMRG